MEGTAVEPVLDSDPGVEVAGADDLEKDKTLKTELDESPTVTTFELGDKLRKS